MTRHWQSTHDRFSHVLGAQLITRVYCNNTGAWHTTGFEIESVAVLEGVERRWSEVVAREPGAQRIRRHRQQAAREIACRESGYPAPA